MARIRTTKPEFWVSEQIAECSTNARLTFIGMWNFCDDRGVHPAKPRTLKAELFPMDDFTADQVGAWVGELIQAGLVAKFSADGDDYWAVTGWAQHQKIDRPSYKHPEPPDFSTTERAPIAEGSSNTSEDSSSATPRNGMDRKGMEGSVDSAKTPNDTRPPSASTAPPVAKPGKTPKAVKTRISTDFAVSDAVAAWAVSKGFDRLEIHLESFKAKSAAKAYSYADWDAAFMEAIRQDWAGIRSGRGAPPAANASPWDGAR